METVSTKVLKSKLNKMGTIGKKRKKRAVTTLRSKRRNPVAKKTVRRRKRTLGAGMSGGGLMSNVKNNLGGAIGGALFTAPSFFMKLPLWGKLAYGIGGAMILGVMKYDHIGAGVTGALVNDIARTSFPTMLADNLEDAEFVDPSTLSDTGLEDGNGNAVVMDDEGIVYALNDSGDYQAIGTTSDLEAMQETSLPSFPLSDVYALNDGY